MSLKTVHQFIENTSGPALDKLREYVRRGDELRRAFFADHAQDVVRLAKVLASCLGRDGKILLCGNGGSAADAQHLAAEFVNRFLLDRRPLPAMALTTDTSILTAVGNDFGFDLVFAKQVQALGRPGDVLLALSTSGNSPNVLEALRVAREIGVIGIGLTGAGGGAMAGLSDHLLAVPSTFTPVVQEVHIAVGHLLCLLTDFFLFEVESSKE
jgi:D-sedoheptulose 7-phosphate isomerase